VYLKGFKGLNNTQFSELYDVSDVDLYLGRTYDVSACCRGFLRKLVFS
jgi:hypothetical protein